MSQNKIILRFVEISEVICGVFGIIILFMCVLQIILRLSFKTALPWVYEATSLLGVYFVFLGISTLVLRGTLARVNFFLEKMPKFLKKFFNFVNFLFTMITGFCIIVGGWNYKDTLKLYTMTNIPISAVIFLYPIIILGFVLFIKGFMLIRELFKDKRIEK